MLSQYIYFENKIKLFFSLAISIAPLLGLFGTIWGIINVFLAMHQNFNINIIAPGIAEALITTLAGLIVAIPAVLFYHIINFYIKQYYELNHLYYLSYKEIIDEKKNNFQSFYNQTENEPEVNLTPLIDTILVILIVFILLMPQIESTLYIMLPKKNYENEITTNQKEHNNYFCLFINQYGEIFLKNNIKINQNELNERIKKELQTNLYNNAIIFADKDTLLEKVTDIIQLLYFMKINKVYIKTKK